MKKRLLAAAGFLKKNFVPIGLVLLLFIGLCVLLYPVVSDYINARHQSRVVAQYFLDMTKMSGAESEQMLADAESYNERLSQNQYRWHLTEADKKEYNALLNIRNTSIMGVVEIPKIGVKLPIYHGTSTGVLQLGLGHFEGSSLPVGGIGTHTVITGHRGLPSSTLLTRLDKLEIGDTFALNVVNRVMTYQVDQILVVLPDEMFALAIDPKMDYCTLMTCTPLGQNTHRLLARGHRVTEEEAQAASQTVSADARALGKPAVAMALFAPAFAAVMVYVIVKYRKSLKRK